VNKADITIGGEYAVVRTYAEYDRDRPLRGRVLAFDQPRRVFPEGSYTAHTTHDGVSVQLLDADTGEPTKAWRSDADAEPIVVQTRNVLRPWDEQIVVNQAREEREVEAASARLSAKRRLDTLNESLRHLELDLNAEADYVTRRDYSGRVTTDTGRVALPISVVEALVRRVHAPH
jgi:hypothetical protein